MMSGYLDKMVFKENERSFEGLFVHERESGGQLEV